jgi:SAM-dependent methyltransferase
MKDWYDDENFWYHLEPFLFDQEKWDGIREEVDQLTGLLRIEQKSKILDLCCGPGRHTLEFARRGHQVTGVDRTKRYLKSAKEQAQTEGLNIEFIESDMRLFKRENTYDAAIMMFTSFGYFERPADDQKVIKNVYKSLKPSGSFILELVGKEVLTRIFRKRDWREAHGTFLLEERKPDETWEHLCNRWIIFKDNSKKEFEFRLRIYSATELVKLLKECGFQETHVYGDLKSSPYNQEANRLVVLACK